jgi:hypothetical protein
MITSCKDEEPERSWRWCRSNSRSGAVYETEKDKKLKVVKIQVKG